MALTPAQLEEKLRAEASIGHQRASLTPAQLAEKRRFEPGVTDNSGIDANNKVSLERVLGIAMPENQVASSLQTAMTQPVQAPAAPAPSRTATFRGAAKPKTAALAPEAALTPVALPTIPNANQGSITTENGATVARGIPGHAYTAPAATPASRFAGYESLEGMQAQRELASAVQSALMNLGPTMRFGSTSPRASMMHPGWGGKVIEPLLKAQGNILAGQTAQAGQTDSTNANLAKTEAEGAHYKDLAQAAQAKQALEVAEAPSKIDLAKAHSTYFREMAKAANKKADRVGTGKADLGMERLQLQEEIAAQRAERTETAKELTKMGELYPGTTRAQRKAIMEGATYQAAAKEEKPSWWRRMLGAKTKPAEPARVITTE